MADSRGEVTVLLGELKLGHKDALERLIPLVYRELRRVAGRCMRDERPGHTPANFDGWRRMDLPEALLFGGDATRRQRNWPS